MTIQENGTSSWQLFLHENPDVEFVLVQFMVYNANFLVRIIPVARFTSLMKTGKLLSLTQAVFYLLPYDNLAEGGSPVGVFYLKPDLSTLYRQIGSPNRAVIMADGVKEDGVTLIEQCPRSRLKYLSDTLIQKKGYFALVGFEVEVVFMKKITNSDGQLVEYQLINKNHSFQSMTTEDNEYFDIVEEIARSLLAAGISIEQFHAEAAPGQWEFVLPPSEPVKAVDVLIKARAIISQIAEKHQLRATLYPRPSESHAGNGAHVHISINTLQENTQKSSEEQKLNQESFFAGIMDHFPAVLAFTLAQQESYSRVQSGIWSGGEYATWGWENKETPLRRIEDNRFELKLMDGLANPYLALSAIFAAGIDGQRRNLRLSGGPCPVGANLLSPEERKSLGITKLLPKSLSESLDKLIVDNEICDLIGQAIIKPYVAVKRGEIEQVKSWTEVERRNYIISRY
jgi:glutamine synthetase